MNLLPVTYTHDAADQMSVRQDSDGFTFTLTYDDAGNPVASAPGFFGWTWDAESRLNEASATFFGTVRTTHVYDGDGKRIEQRQPGETTRYVWDGDNVLLETDQSNAPTGLYTHEPQQYGLLISRRRGAESDFYHFDALGSTDRLTDANGDVTQRYFYTAFGGADANPPGNPYQWIGQLGYQFNADLLASYYVRNRHFDWVIFGRWTNRDRKGFAGGDWNLYRYVQNNPMNGVDPSGLGYGETLWKILGWIPGVSVIINAVTPAPGSNVLDYTGCKPPLTCAGGNADDVAIQQCYDCVHKIVLQSVISTTIGGVVSGSLDALVAALLKDLAKTLAKKAVVFGIFGAAAIADVIITAVKVVHILDASRDAKNKFCK